MGKVYKDTVGTVIQIDMGEDVSDASTTNILVRKGEGSTTTWTASVSSTDSNVLEYTTVASDLDEVGKYYLQPSLAFSTWAGLGDTVTFTVYNSWG